MQVYRHVMTSTLLLLLLAIAAPSTTFAHFVWLGVAKKDKEQPTAQVWFGESAAPGEGELIEKIAATEVWAIAADGTQTKLAHETVVTGDEGALVCPLEKPFAQLAAQIDYGVIDRGDGPFLLKYFARHVTMTTDGLAKVSQKNSSNRQLPVDIAAELSGARLQLTVLVAGKPYAGAELIIDGPRGKEIEIETDKQGRATVDAKHAGGYNIRAKVVDSQGGEFQGKKYGEIRQYATLSFDIPKNIDAATLLQNARESRADWGNFPGFTADATIYSNGKAQQGQITVSAKGDVKLTGFDPQPKGVMSTLRSMVMHRMAGAADQGPVSLVSEAEDHPLGQLVKLDYDTAMGSTYRLRDNVIRQVNRESDEGHFTISVLDVTWNDDGKYLPAVYNVAFWNKDGSLRSSSTVRDQWQRVENVDLPTRHFIVTASKDKLDYVRMEFSNHQLLSEK